MSRSALAGLLIACATPPADAPPAAGTTRLACPDGPVDAVAAEPVADCAGWRLRAELRGGAASIRVETLAGEGGRWSWALPEALPAPDGVAGLAEGQLHVCTAAAHLAVDPARCAVAFADASGTLSEATLADDGRTWSLTLDAEAPVLGAGGRTGDVDQRGTERTFRGRDAYDPACEGWCPDADPLYVSIPTWLTHTEGRAWGVFVDNPARQVWDLRQPGLARLRADSGTSDLHLFAGPTPAAVGAARATLLGPPLRWPRWAWGFHQSRWGWYPDDAVLDVATRLRAEGLAADAIWLDIQHMDGFRSFTFDPVGFADPSGLDRQLDALGFHTVAILDPGLKVDPGWEIYDAAVSGDLLIATDRDGPYVGEVWPGPSVFPDFTDPAARAWWASLIPRLTDRGIDGLWIDMNEPSDFAGPDGTVPDALPVHGDGAPTTMATAHNAYASLEAVATVVGLRQALPDRRPFVLSRAGYAGIHRFAATWTGDAPSSWPTLQTTLPMMIGMSASGLFHVGSDVGGYSGRATPELFARWMQLGAISPFYRAHTATTGAPQEPWQFGQEVLDISRGLLAWRSALRPYLDGLNDEAIRTGAPILRPLAWEFPGEPALWSVGDEAMLGPWLLVAPVLAEGARTRAIRLPAGRWFELNTGAAVDGPATVTWDVKLGTLPIYVREGAILPRDPPRAYADAPAEAVRYLDLWPANAPTAWTLYEDDGEGRAWESGALSRRQVELAPTASGVTVTLAPATGTWRWPERTLELVLHRIDHAPTAVRVDGADAADWTWDPAALSLTVRAPDRDGLRVETDVDRALLALAPPVVMPFWVDVPPGTPTDAPMTVAADVDGWVFHPLTWSADGTHATGALTVPRGVWFEYKYQRGSWETVEKWPACEEAANRYEQGRAAPKRDRVWAWRDQCP